MVMVRKPGAYHPQGLIAVTSGCNTVSKVGLEVERTGVGERWGVVTIIAQPEVYVRDEYTFLVMNVSRQLARNAIFP